MKCSHGQTYDAGGSTCSATGTATQVQYCSVADESCNDATTKILNGLGTSGAYTACHGLNSGAGTFGKTNWRVPKQNELKTLIQCTNNTIPTDGNQCGAGNFTSPVVDNLFPNTQSQIYWSTTYAPNTSVAWFVGFSNGDVSVTDKSVTYYVRCVSGP